MLQVRWAQREPQRVAVARRPDQHTQGLAGQAEADGRVHVRSHAGVGELAAGTSPLTLSQDPTNTQHTANLASCQSERGNFHAMCVRFSNLKSMKMVKILKHKAKESARAQESKKTMKKGLPEAINGANFFSRGYCVAPGTYHSGTYTIAHGRRTVHTSSWLGGATLMPRSTCSWTPISLSGSTKLLGTNPCSPFWMLGSTCSPV